MSIIHNDALRRVPCLVGLPNQGARICWSEVALTLDEIRDVDAAKTRFLIAYGCLLYPLFQIYNIVLTRITP
jgi:hypothetical protein